MKTKDQKAAVVRARRAIAPDLLVGEIQKVITALTVGYVPIYDVPGNRLTLEKIRKGGPEATTVVGWREMDRADLNRYGVLLKANLSLLSKSLPDLKSVELTDSTDQANRFTDVELAQRLTSLLAGKRPAPAPPHGDASPHGDAPAPPVPPVPPGWLN